MSGNSPREFTFKQDLGTYQWMTKYILYCLVSEPLKEEKKGTLL